MSRIFGAALAPAVVAFAGPAADAASKIEAITSPGGIKAWLVREPSVPMIALDYAFTGGAQCRSGRQAGGRQHVAAMLDEGAGDLDARAFQERMEEKAIQLGFTASRDHFRGSLRSLSANLDEAVNLLRLALTVPRFDAEPVERIRGQLLAELVKRQHQSERHRQPALVGGGVSRPPLWPSAQRHAGSACRHHGRRPEGLCAQRIRARHADHRHRRRHRCARGRQADRPHVRRPAREGDAHAGPDVDDAGARRAHRGRISMCRRP